MLTNVEENWYEVLGLSPSATALTIKAVKKEIAREHHPDRGGDEAVYKRLNHAIDILGNPVTRKEFDERLAGLGSRSVSDVNVTPAYDNTDYSYWVEEDDWGIIPAEDDRWSEQDPDTDDGWGIEPEAIILDEFDLDPPPVVDAPVVTAPAGERLSVPDRRRPASRFEIYLLGMVLFWGFALLYYGTVLVRGLALFHDSLELSFRYVNDLLTGFPVLISVFSFCASLFIYRTLSHRRRYGKPAKTGHRSADEVEQRTVQRSQGVMALGLSAILSGGAWLTGYIVDLLFIPLVVTAAFALAFYFNYPGFFGYWAMDRRRHH